MSKINWVTAREFEDITYKKCDGVARIAFNRPDVRNAFRPKTTKELIEAFYDAQEDTSIGVVLLSAEGPSSKDGIWSFCSGGDQKARGHQGYVGEDGYHRLNILEVQRMIRFMPKAVICVVPGWAVGGGHSLHVVCDLTLASKEHAIFKQTDADVTSFDGGYGSGLLARTIGQKRSREVWYLCDQYGAEQAYDWGLVNSVVPLEDLEIETVSWARRMLELSPLALRMLKASHNAVDDGLAGIQQLAGDATLLFYMSQEAQEGRDAFKERRAPDFRQFPKRP